LKYPSANVERATDLTATCRSQRQQAVRRVGKLGLGFVGVLLVSALGLPVGLAYLADRAVWTIPLGIGAFLALGLTGAARLAVMARRARRTHLDAELGALGLSGQDETLRALYRGRWKGRDLSICHLGPRGRYSAALLLIRLDTPLRGRLMIRARPVPIARTPGVTELPQQRKPLDNLRIWCSQPEWATKLLTSNEARCAIAALMAAGSDHQLDLRPDGLLLRIRHVDIAEIVSEGVGAWLARLDTLLAGAEQLAQTTPLEEQAICFAERWEAGQLSPADGSGSRAWVWMFAGLVSALVLAAVLIVMSRS
jgi:F0F1-type ATP synthase assembly protein I